MIAVFIVILAIAAQINAQVCQLSTVPLSTLTGSGSSCSKCGGISGSVSTPINLPFFVAGNSVSGSASSTATRNLVGQGKYPVSFGHSGPIPNRQVPVSISHVTAPLQEKPTVNLKCDIPAPKTLSHSCTCYKTIVRPRVHQQLINVPVIQRFLQTTHKPVIENIQYEASPLDCAQTSAPVCDHKLLTIPSSGCSRVDRPIVSQLPAPVISEFQSNQLSNFGPGLSQGSLCSRVSVPEIQTIRVQVPEVQSIKVPVPEFQSVNVQVPEVQTFGAPIPEFQPINVQPQVQTVRLSVPQFQSFELPKRTCF